MTRSATSSTATPAGHGVGYARLPRPGVIEALHALDPSTGRSLCDQPMAIAWSAEDAAGTEIDCQLCREAIEQRVEAS
jgi:hypothetical protein